MSTDPIAKAIELMHGFALRTERPGQRYLWTDAFAVDTYLALAVETHDARHEQQALDLVARVHRELGRGSPEHPLAGGLRIGKALPERGPNEPYDPDLEWERDGQYFHYLTKWMLALDKLARHTKNETYHRWARELALVAHGAFAHGPKGDRRMYWKMSVDLTRPLVRHMGQHDPLDGYVTCVELDASAAELGFQPVPDLGAVREDFAQMVGQTALVTSDPLGLGELLIAARRLERAAPRDPLASRARSAALRGLAAFVDTDTLRAPVEKRLAFRELGLAIGLASLRPHDFELEPFAMLRNDIETFWLDPAHEHARSWREHENINAVMLAACLCADIRFASDPRAKDWMPPAAIRAVNRCIEVCIDGEKGYALAAADTHDPRLKALLHHYATQRSEFAQSLQGALGQLGFYAEAESTGRGFLHRTWMEAREALRGHDDASLLSACERGERAAIDAYDQVFRTFPPGHLPPNIRSVLLDQRAAIQSAREDIAGR